MKTGPDKTEWIVGAIHAENGKAKEKWDHLNRKLDSLIVNYTTPMLLYVDVNTEITDEKYLF